MKLNLVLGTALAAVLLAPGVQAASITNLESKAHTIKVLSGDQERDFTIQPSESVDLNKVCSPECVVVLQNGDEYDVAKGEAFSIDEGSLFSEPSAQGSDASEGKDTEKPR